MKAAVMYEVGAPLKIDDVQLDEPQANEILVKLVATGVCHTDLHFMKGDMPAPVPVIPGHEGAGIVEKVGPGVTTVKPGDHVIAAEDMYGGTYRLFEEVFKPFGLQFTYVGGDTSDFDKAIRPETALIWIESPTNPLLRIIDISGVSAIAHRHNIRVVVDNTFASPYFQRPLLLGADLVVHSATKYLGGHSDLIGGALIVNNEEWYTRLKFLQNAIGAVPGAFDSWLMLRGIKTLSVRMKQHEKNAIKIAAFLESHPKIFKVYYPGLKSNPFHELAKQQMSGFGGMMSFKLRSGDKEVANSFFKRLKLISLAESLGGVESLICYPSAMTHSSMPEKQRDIIGVTKDLIRLSIGIEDIDDLIEDISIGLNY